MFIFFVDNTICKYTNQSLNIAAYSAFGCGCGPLASPQYYLCSSGWDKRVRLLLIIKILHSHTPPLPFTAAPDPSPSLAPELLLRSGPSISASTNPPGSSMRELRSSETRMGITSTIINEDSGELTTWSMIGECSRVWTEGRVSVFLRTQNGFIGTRNGGEGR